jgi:hypothetical protein
MSMIKGRASPSEALFNQYLMVFPNIKCLNTGEGTEPPISATSAYMECIYDRLDKMKQTCRHLFSELSPNRRGDPVEFLRDWIAKDHPKHLPDWSRYNTGEFTQGDIRKYVTNAAIPLFLDAVREYENDKGSPRIKPSFEEFGNRLKAGLSGTPWRKSSNVISYYQNYGKTHILRRPMETAFGDVLYETSTLEFLKDAKQRSHL